MTAAVAAVVAGRGSAPTPTEVVLDALRPDEVLVRIAASGICHTDLTAIDGGVPFGFPAVFGHEGAGTIAAVGDAVTHLDVGDRVVLTFDTCGRCRRCRAGRPAYCEQFAARNYAGVRPDGSATLRDGDGTVIAGSWMAQSSWATHAIARSSNVVPIGEQLPFALAAPLGCGVLTGAGTVLHVLDPDPADTVLVIGAGVVGLAGVMAARARGCAQVTVVEPRADRRALARRLGAGAAVAPEALAADLGDIGPVDLVLDTVGTQEAVATALSVLGIPRDLRDGRPATGGQSRRDQSDATALGRTLTGVIEGDARPSEMIPLLIGLWQAGLFPLEELVRAYPFGDLIDALDAARDGSAVKAVLLMDEDEAGGAAAPARPSPGRTVAQRVRELVTADHARTAELQALWDVLPPAAARDLRGLWRGTGMPTGHFMGKVLVRAGWYGKNFLDGDRVQPIVCRLPDGSLAANTALARGGAFLLDSRHRGRVSATMVYDAQPVHDHFVRVDDDTLLGVMAGAGTLHDGEPYFFLLEREDAHPHELPETAASGAVG